MKQSGEHKFKSILVIVLGFAILYAVLDYRYKDYQYAVYFLYVSIALGVLSLLITSFGDLLVKLWFKLAEILGYIPSKVLLSLVFFLFLFPLAWLSRRFSKNPLQLKNDSDSVFVERNHTYTKEDLENIW
ncbi:MAG: SxtJ family membrane protein [Bacteroidota bacterium]